MQLHETLVLISFFGNKTVWFINIDFNGMSTRLALFYAKAITFIVSSYLHFLCDYFLRNFFFAYK